MFTPATAAGVATGTARKDQGMGTTEAKVLAVGEFDAMHGPKVDALRADVDALLQEVAALKITNDVDEGNAVAARQLAKEFEAQADALFNPTINAANATHKKALAAKRASLGPIIMLRKAIDSKLATYHTAKERAAAEERRRLQAEQAKLDEERRLAAALEAEAVGADTVADAILEAPPAPKAVHVPVTKPDGISYRTTWVARVVNIRALLTHALTADAEMEALVSLNMPELNRRARAHKDSRGEVLPGVVAVPKKTVV